MTPKARIAELIRIFQETQPRPQSELHYENPYQLLVAVILSAQCTDKRVNLTTPAFFKTFPTPERLAESTVEEIFLHIRSISYPNSKAKNLLGMAQVLVRDFQSVVPEDIDDLQKMPGVGRKTANVIASVIFRKPALAVDTHVFRVAARLGLSVGAKTPLETEKQLMKLLAPAIIPDFHHWLILHGRYVCRARSPLCESCPIAQYCPSFSGTALPQKAKEKQS